MPYVMVPVPEEHVEDVMQFVMRAIARASMEPWDAESVSSVFTEVDEVTRSFLAFIARAALEGEELADAEAARRIQMTLRETAGIMNELGGIARDQNRPVLVSARLASERLPNGRMKDTRVFMMDLDIAALIAEAEQAELRALPHPLAGPSG